MAGKSTWFKHMTLKVMAVVKNMTICNPTIDLQYKRQYIKLHVYNGDVNFAHFFLHNIHSRYIVL